MPIAVLRESEIDEQSSNKIKFANLFLTIMVFGVAGDCSLNHLMFDFIIL